MLSRCPRGAAVLDARNRLRQPPASTPHMRPPVAALDGKLARNLSRLARHAIQEACAEESCAVALVMNEDFAGAGARSIVQALTSVWDDDPPDLALIERSAASRTA